MKILCDTFVIREMPFFYEDALTARTKNLGSEMVEEKHVFEMKMLCSKRIGGKMIEFLCCPFEGKADLHNKIQPNSPKSQTAC